MRKKSRGRTLRHYMVHVNSAFCHRVAGPTQEVKVCRDVGDKRECLYLRLKSGSWLEKCPCGSKAENHRQITGSPGNVKSPQRPPTFHTLARTPAGKTFPQKTSAGRRWSGTINFTLVLPASKPCWSNLRISWHSDTPHGL